MIDLTFGQFLHLIRTRQNATHLAKKAGISYVYLLDIEKGARPVPKQKILLALAENLDFKKNERELFFDLAAKEKSEIPADITEYIKSNQEIVDVLRKIKQKPISDNFWGTVCESIQGIIDKEDKL